MDLINQTKDSRAKNKQKKQLPLLVLCTKHQKNHSQTNVSCSSSNKNEDFELRFLRRNPYFPPNWKVGAIQSLFCLCTIPSLENILNF